MVVPESAHAAFHKAAHLFGIELTKTPVKADWTADVDSMAAAIRPETVLLVGSSPQFPQGVVDDLPAVAALAEAAGANCHSDACMGGFVLPFAEMLGRPVPPWDFRVPGITSISADVHKLGYAPKGASVILYRDRALRAYQTFSSDAWLGGFYATPNLQGSRPGLPMATAWAVMSHLGVDGYKRLTETTLATADKMRAGIAATPGLRVLAAGAYHLVAMAADPDADQPLDVFALGDALARRGWHLDRQGPPDSLHATVSFGNAAVIDLYLAHLAASVEEVGGARAGDRSTRYATLE
jgi:glutamate/tyrosine decarboxylase-like PLP-dependent enzyme